MKTIHKFTLKIKDQQVMKLPKGARIISVLNQRENVVMYAEVENPASDYDVYTIYVYGTGHHVTHGNPAVFIGTVSTFDGSLIWHVYARKD